MQKPGYIPEGVTDAKNGSLIPPVEEVEMLLRDIGFTIPCSIRLYMLAAVTGLADRSSGAT